MSVNYTINTIYNQNDIIGDFNHIHDYYSIYTKNERDIIIWLPPSYIESFKKYPVLYIHDGQNIFDPATAFTGYDWKADETADYLIKNNFINEMIIVGIYNTNDRLDEYNIFSSKGEQYANFIIKELKPYIDENYRTLSNAEFTTTIGSSMGGLCSFQLAMKYPNVFGNTCCLSSSFWVDDRGIFDFMKIQNKLNNIKIYLDCGLNEKQLIKDSLKMCAILKDIGYNSDNFYCHIDENGHHSEMDWARRLYLPLTFIYGKNGKARELLYQKSELTTAS
jgi:predicted alpha/beta superfamily hydrolase